MTDQIRVLIADDHPMFRTGVGLALKAAGTFDVVGEAGNAHEAIALAQQLRPHVRASIRKYASSC
jgi:two-component system, NarL family, nitrate/nitrite response regulator NarL